MLREDVRITCPDGHAWTAKDGLAKVKPSQRQAWGVDMQCARCFSWWLSDDFDAKMVRRARA
jgi:hypothetical protein